MEFNQAVIVPHTEASTTNPWLREKVSETCSARSGDFLTLREFSTEIKRAPTSVNSASSTTC